jgi:hypothetical protein
MTALILPGEQSSQITKRFESVREFLRSRKDWRRFPRTYTGFKKAWRKSGPALSEALWREFQARLPELAGSRWRWKGWVPLAVDGSRFDAPRTRANEQGQLGQVGLGCAGKPHTTPQVQVTLLEHVFAELPFAAKTGPGTDSEQTHLSELIESLPEKTLLIADAGFFSYSLASRLIGAGHAFLLRVGGNKQLLTELFGEDAVQFRSDQDVWVWPPAARRQGEPPLRLRLIELATPREDTPNVFLLTNLSEEELSDEEAAAMYHERWGLEVSYRTLKQVFERAGLRSRTPEMVLAEMDWLLLGTFLLGALALGSQPPRKRSQTAWSPAKTLEQVRRRIRYGDRRGGRWSKRIDKDLRACVIDRAPRHGPKSTRAHPQKKHQKPPAPPKVRPATQAERQQAQKFRGQQHPNQFTA